MGPVLRIGTSGLRLSLEWWFLCGIVAGLGFFCGETPRDSWAAEWSVLPSISGKGVYNSNLLLTPSPHDATYGYWVSPGAEFAGKTERFEVSGRAAADFVSYYGGEDIRFTNLYFPLSLRSKTEVDVFGFTGGFIRDNTLMGELLTTGVVLQFTQRNLWSANPTWTRSLTEKFAIQGTFQFTDATYDNGLRLGLVDYQLFGGSSGLLYQFTEQDQIQLSGLYFNFHTTNAPFGVRATFPGAALSLTHAFTETLTGTVYGGPRFVSSTTQTTSDFVKTRETVWVFGASVAKKFESATVQVYLTRDIIPSGFGLLIQTDRAQISASYNVSETLTAAFDTSGYLVSGVTTSGHGLTLQENRYFYLTPKVSWKFLEWWKLEASYTYGWRNAEGFPEPAMANAAMVTLTYYPPKLAISK